MHNKPVRSDEPIYWLLFGAGGMTVAMALPAVLILLIAAGIASPDINSGLLNFEQIKGMLGNWLVALLIFGAIFTIFWHAFHRMYHGLHDLGIHTTKLHFFLFYGAAAACSFIALGLQLVAYFKLW